ncbi:carboxypeptidase regulatory-like domain-containing protein, partial [Fulvivirga kasyanovii]|nr:carboxypeptidase regulatory-like domain-containing protein [Fulvivirga kasyanovii]
NAVKGDKNNIGAGVQTDTLIEGKMNKVTIIIE